MFTAQKTVFLGIVSVSHDLCTQISVFPVQCCLGPTVEKRRVQPGKTVPREFPREQPEGTYEGQFFQAARGFSAVSQTLVIL